VYKSSRLTIWLARKLVGTKCAGLANILLDDKLVMPELIQEQATLNAMLKEVLPLLNKESVALQQQSSFDVLRQRLGDKNPSEAVANMAINMLLEESS